MQSGVRLQENYYQTQQSGVRQTLPKPKCSFILWEGDLLKPGTLYLHLSVYLSICLSPSQSHVELLTDSHSLTDRLLN